MNADALFRRYQELQAYVGWSTADAERVHSLATLLEPCLPALIEDFYAEIDKHPEARKVITGGEEQVKRLKGTLIAWLRELLSGQYDADYVIRRWRVGCRHVEIGLDQVYTNVALSRLRRGLLERVQEVISDPRELAEKRCSLNMLLDLDLAIIEDAYQAEYACRQQRVERLAAIGQVAGGIAHEIRNPLNVVKTSVYYLLNARNPTPAKVAEHLKRIEEQVTLTDGVITALSSFAKMPLPVATPFCLRSCIEATLNQQPLPETITLTLDFPATLPPVLGDPEQLKIVFSNLIRNARDAMPSGGSLAIRATQNGNLVDAEVVDTGVGIPPENLHRITEPLYSTKARGLGLGLALARAILEKNNGKLHVTSEVGRGSTFIVRLPAAQQ